MTELREERKKRVRFDGLACGLMSLLIAAATWTPAQAEPNAVTKYLINEPATMLDLGLDDLDQLLQRQKHIFMYELDVKEAEEAAFGVGATYDLDDNKISISMHCDNCGLSPDEKLCASGIKLLRDYLV